jgi:hypothetical protein
MKGDKKSKDHKDEDSDDEDDEEDEIIVYNNSWKKYILLFLIFVFIINESFVENVLPCSALNGRKITAWGIILQGLILVVLYGSFVHLIDIGWV